MFTLDCDYAEYFNSAKQKKDNHNAGTVIRISQTYIVVEDSNGNGIRITYDPKKHSAWKKGDIVDIS